MPQPYPLPRSYREAGPYDFDGVSKLYGPFGAPSQFSIFDPQDVVIEVRESATADWAEVAATIAKTTTAALSPFTVTFADVFPATHDFRLSGRRLHERSLDVTKGNSLSADKLELELSKQGVCLQELRRDVDGTASAVDDVVETVAHAVETVTTTATTVQAAAVIVATEASAAADAAALANRLANDAPGTPVGSGYSARHWAQEAATLAATLDLSNYSTTAQIDTMLTSYVLKTLTIASGLGVLVNGGASAQLSGTVTVSLDLSAKALTQATWTAGVSTVEAPISPAKLAAVFAALKSGLVLTKSYVSAEQALVAGGLTTLAHGLGASPKIVIIKLVCKTAENGYSVGDVVLYPVQFTQSSNQGILIRITSTNIYVLIGNYGPNPVLMLTSSGALATTTPANWKMIVEAYA